MAGEPSSGSISTTVKSLNEVAGSIAAVLTYLLALFGLGDTPYPKTTSLITILVTTVIVMNWRWRAIQHRKKDATTPGNESKPIPKRSMLERILEPFEKTGPEGYALSLKRRRTEGGFLFTVSLAVLVWSGLNMPAVAREVTARPDLMCSYSKGRQRLLVMVADLNQTSASPPLLVADKVYDSLVSDQMGSLYDVCRLMEVIQGTAVARQKASSYKADVVIWGRSDVIYEIHLEVPRLENPDRQVSELSSQEAASVEFQIKEPDRISFVAQYVLSQLFYLNGQVQEAQNRLSAMLAKADLDSPVTTTPKDMAEPYFMLGLMYDPNYSQSAEHPDEQKAILAYSRALELDPALHAARLNRGLLYSDAGQVEKAIADYNYLIDNNTSYQGSAYINRAFLQTDPQAALADLDKVIEFDPAEGYFFRGNVRRDVGDLTGAMEDFRKAIEYDPEGYYNYHLLGETQLLASETEAASQTYRQILPYLDQETRELIIFDLQQIADDAPETEAAIQQIIKKLKAEKLPNP